MFVTQSLQLLKDNNQKITKTRTWILEKFANITKPVNPYELVE
jgi:Fe2+ or Zn2+ uptake regulation protein